MTIQEAYARMIQGINDEERHAALVQQALDMVIAHINNNKEDNNV